MEEKKYILSAEEREFCFNINCAEDEASIDIAKCSTYNKYIKMLDKLVEEGKARVFIEDEHHKYFKVNKNALNYIVPKHTKNLTEEQRLEASERLKALRTKTAVNNT